MKLEGKVAIVTGASSGMGNAIAKLYAKEGATVVAFARRKERLDELVAQTANEAGTVVPFVGDLCIKEDVENLMDFTIKNHGGIDILVNNAGVLDDFLPAAEVTDEVWDKCIQTNLTSVMWTTRAALEPMLEKKAGSIIVIASAGGLMGGRAGAAYTASKHGVVGLVKNTGFMYGRSGIRCNAICPGGVATEISANMRPSAFGYGRVGDAITATTSRLAEASEIASVALFLATDEAININGAAIPVDGGFVAF
ncbi:MAG: SDR family NAD(P)-dependent oxidoreductase [Coriobacteriia bacterium]|jgi:NAD(P)-dependent dehydrogenase (short-subunit alcohol dehydrogenase family)|nr:SDR family NAD(P)-dependent oxidoreductase [Coriobacteriia bacterium]MDR2714596.1 SDR family NAD(P)-dependent oxidoreductase [Coriobacteriales bacterium]